ncbi:glycosyltransferase family 2 protein, partial [Sporolactobacillus vineae]
MDHLITIIVPVYNVAKYLSKCIRSIINQSYPNLEIILIDDGSTDNSGRLCDQFAKLDKRIRVIHKKNGGLSDARNAGIDLAKGELIAFVDSDDYIHRDMYLRMYEVMLKYHCDIVEVDFQEVNEKVDPNNIPEEYAIKVFDRKCAIINTIVDHYCRNYVWNKLYRKDLWVNIRFPKGRAFEDVYTTHRVINKVTSLVKLEIPLYYYFQRNNSIVRSSSVKNNVDHCEALNETLLFMKEMYPDLLPLVCIKYDYDMFYCLYTLLRKRKQRRNSNVYNHTIAFKIIRTEKYISSTQMFLNLCHQYLLDDYDWLYQQRKIVLFQLTLLKKSLILFYIYVTTLKIFSKIESLTLNISKSKFLN